MTSAPPFIQSDNISEAWAQAFIALSERGVDELIPLVVNVRGFSDGRPNEIPDIRAALDTRLKKTRGAFLPATTANLIFPENLWLRYRNEGRDIFFNHYIDVTVPRLKAVEKRNSTGTYFERMISYGPNGVNQLKHLIETRLGGNKRRSALQIMVFDPAVDHKDSPYLPFPCLDYLACSVDHGGGLSLTAFYATQYIFDRAYGNYLGLCALGRFIAEQLGTQFTQLTCIAGTALRGNIDKGDAKRLAAELREQL